MPMKIITLYWMLWTIYIIKTKRMIVWKPISCFFVSGVFICFILKLYIIMHCTDMDVHHIDSKYLWCFLLNVVTTIINIICFEKKNNKKNKLSNMKIFIMYIMCCDSFFFFTLNFYINMYCMILMYTTLIWHKC